MKVSAKNITKRIGELTSMGLIENQETKAFEWKDQVFPLEDIKTVTDAQWTDAVNAFLLYKQDEERQAPPLEEAIQGENLTQEDTPKDVQLIGIRNADTDIATLDLNDKILQEWKEKYSGLIISGLDDKENYLKVKEAKSFIRGRRTSLENKRTQLKEYYIQEGRKIDEAAKKYKAAIEEIEGPLDIELSKFDEWKKADDKRKEEEAAAELNRRVRVLKEAGMVFNNSYYEIGGTMSFDIVTIKALSGFDFDIIVEKVKVEKRKLDEAAADALQKKEKEDRFNNRVSVLAKSGILFDGAHYVIGNIKINPVDLEALSGEEFENFHTSVNGEKSRLQEEKESFEKQKKELAEQQEAMRRQKLQLRETMAKTIGLQPNSAIPGYQFKNEFESLVIDMNFIQTAEEEQYMSRISDFTVKISAAKQKAQDKENEERQKELLFDGRVSQLQELGMLRAGEAFTFSLINVNRIERITFQTILDTDSDNWPNILSNIRLSLGIIKEEQETYERRLKELEFQYQERQYSLINLGMVIVSDRFIVKNEFEDSASIGIDKVKALDPDVWSRVLMEVSEDVKRIKDLTMEKRAEIERQKEALKPELQRCQEFIKSVGSLSGPEFKNEKVKGIIAEFSRAIAAAAQKAQKDLLDCE